MKIIQVNILDRVPVRTEPENKPIESALLVELTKRLPALENLERVNVTREIVEYVLPDGSPLAVGKFKHFVFAGRPNRSRIWGATDEEVNAWIQKQVSGA